MLVPVYVDQCSVEIINVDDEGQGGSSENVIDVVHPSNMEVRCSHHACLNFSYSV